MDYAYQFVIDNHGIDTEKDYPYQGGELSCNKAKVRNNSSTAKLLCPKHTHFSQIFTSPLLFLPKSMLQLKRHVVTIDGYTDVAQGNEQQLLQAVATQPVSVGICGSARAFQLYSKVCPKASSKCKHIIKSIHKK